jgi:hypothetical protein
MKRGYNNAPNAALAVGLGFVAFAIYASLTHQMSWFKLILFWIGAGAIVFYLLHHIFSRVYTFRPGKKVSRYRTRHRVFSAAILLVGLTGAVNFTQKILQGWKLPAAYWEFLEEIPGPPNQYQGRWAFGNQRYQEALHLREIQLIELGSLALHEKGGVLEISCQIDSQPLAVTRDSVTSVHRLALPDGFEVSPLHAATVQLDIRFRHRFAIYDMAAIYEVKPTFGNGKAREAGVKSIAIGQYILVESPRTELVEFAQLARLAQRPSLHTRETVIYALGRSRHPQAWRALQELLAVNDLRVQGAVCQAMTYLGDPRATDALIRLVKRNKIPQAVRALATIAAPEGIDFLLDLLKDPKEESYLRVTAAAMIGETKLRVAVPALEELVKDNDEKADFTLKHEALSALARIDRALATQVAIAAVQGFPDRRQIRTCLETIAELDHEKMLPLLADWLANWRRYDLDADDVQAMLSHIVAGDHRGMVAVAMEALLHEPTAEMQFKFVSALTVLAGKDFGQIEYPEISQGAQEANQRVIEAWSRWWGRARKETIYAEQVSPVPAGNKI